MRDSGARLGMCIFTRTTTTKIRRHADKEYKKQYPKPRRQTNLCTLVHCFSYISAFACVSMSIYVSLYAAWVTDPCAQPLKTDLIQS